MEIRKITDIDTCDPAAVEKAFAAVDSHAVDCCNWPEEYPYAPRVGFRMFHTGAELLLRFEVEEACTMARIDRDNGEVWTDSCVEFFIAPDEAGYYNFETNCIGRMLLGYRGSPSEAEHAPAGILAAVRRRSSLPPGPFAERQGDNRWSLTLAIPPRALFRHALSDWSGVEARANFYKCGDALSRPHFLSWRPIGTEKPDFHRPEYFDKIIFAR